MGRGIRLLDITPPFPSPPSISSLSSSSLSSLTVMIIVLSSALILSTSLYLLLRRLSLHPSSTTTAAPRQNRRQSVNSASLSLPIFKFRSLVTNNNADCAICFASFESDDQLRLLPLCCHAFHAVCIDTWLSSSHDTCPLCRSTVHPTEADALDKTLTRASSYRIEFGSLRRGTNATGLQRSYSIGPLEYVVGESYEVAVENKEAGLGGDDVAGRSWLMDYVDRIGSFSSRTFSRRGSGSFWNGSVRRGEVVGRVEDLEAYRIGEEISEIFRWLSGV